MAERRTLRSGKEFSAFDLALERAITTLTDYTAELSIADCIEDHPLNPPDTAEDLNPLDTATSPKLISTPTASKHVSALQNDKKKSKVRRAKKREQARLASTNPAVKSVCRQRIADAKKFALHAGMDAGCFSHTRSGWRGLREGGQTPKPGEIETAISGRVYSQQEIDALNEEATSGTGMGGRAYTQEEIDAIVGTAGFMYIAWLGLLTIPILDAQRRVIAVLGGRPRDPDWQRVADGAHALMQDSLPRLRLSSKRLRHRRAQRSFAAVSRGPSYGSGQEVPGELRNNVANTIVTDELLSHEYFKRISGFANALFVMWAPNLYAYYLAQMEKLRGWKKLRWNFLGSAFAGSTFNFGPRTITARHLDFANLAWGWCSITALGNFDPDRGGLLILWDLRLVIRFPPGSTVLIPSALVHHSNTPIRRHETRSSFAQYTAAGLFHWIQNGFRTDKMFDAKATDEEKAQRAADDAVRWEEGVAMYSNIDEL